MYIRGYGVDVSDTEMRYGAYFDVVHSVTELFTRCMASATYYWPGGTKRRIKKTKTKTKII